MVKETFNFEEGVVENETKQSFDFNNFISKNFIPLALLLVGVILAGIGVFISRAGLSGSTDKVEVLNAEVETENSASEIVVELAGAVEKPSIYHLPENSRISDLLIAGGGLSADADREWVERYVNQAALLTDGQKLYIPKAGESQSNTETANISSTVVGSSGDVFSAESNISKTININMATLSELDKLPGIGPVYGQNIIDQRPYSSVEELLTKKVLRSDVYEKIKDKVSVY